MTSFDQKNIFEAVDIIKGNLSQEIDNFIECFDVILTWLSIIMKRYTNNKIDSNRLYDFLQKVTCHLQSIGYKPNEEEINIIVNIFID